MRRPLIPAARLGSALLAGALLMASCTGSSGQASSTMEVTSTSTTGAPADPLADLPPEARTSAGGGDPRPPAYWAVWNTCAPSNRAAEAEANGGRPAGWVLVDDVLADPGIGLGDHVLRTCEESVALLEGRTGAGDETSEPVYRLAGELLAAELNLTVGAESCPVAEEAVVGAHLVLAAANFDGASSSPLDGEAGGALPRLLDLLGAYNSGGLCR